MTELHARLDQVALVVTDVDGAARALFAPDDPMVGGDAKPGAFSLPRTPSPAMIAGSEESRRTQ